MTTTAQATKFIPGQIIFASLACAHGDFRVRIVRRTEKSIWVEPVDITHEQMPLKRCGVKMFGSTEYAKAYGWHLAADSLTSRGHDPHTI